MPLLRLVRAPVVGLLVSLLLVAWSARPARGAAEPLLYDPPVAGEVVDPFRPPSHRFGPGNRGIDYATAPGTPVRAAARGVVAFAGPVGGTLHVTVLHPDGVRTTYSFLRSIGVRRGERVERGQEVGRAGDRLHFGARLGDTYLDPRSLLGRASGHARLVPDDDVRPAAEATERRMLRELLRRVRGAARAGMETASHAAAAAKARFAALAREHVAVAEWLAAVGELSPATWVTLGGELAAALRQAEEPCTPAEHPPPRLSGRRVLVLVGGLGSSSASAGIEGVEERALGYAAEDVHRFSYRGGTVGERPYGTADTTGDIRWAGKRLASLLRRLAARDPGVPVDVVAHSLGGVVARAALAEPGAPPQVHTLVTLGSPHQGADLAASALVARGNPAVRGGAALLRALRLTDLDGDAPALRQLVPGSALLRELARLSLPAGLRVTSVAARGDVVVASSRSRLSGARNVVVTVDGLHDHALLPRSAAAQREIALAVGGRPPTCRGRGDAALDVLAARLVRQQQRLAGPALRLDLPLRPGG